jgi:hypothetical protein
MKLPGIFISVMLCLGAVAQTSKSVPSKPIGSDTTASVQGMVVNSATGKPLDGVHVMLVGWGPDQQPEIIYGAMSNSTGHFALSPIPHGGYGISLERRGFIQVVAKKGVGANAAMFLHPGEQVRDLILEMVPRSIISGRVLDENGDPVMGAFVAALPVSPEQVTHSSPTITTNDRGEFRISVGPGKYRVKAALSSFGPAIFDRNDGSKSTYVETYYPGVKDTESARVIEIRPGSELSGVEIKLQRSPIFRISGRVSGVPADATAQIHAEQDAPTGTSSISAGELPRIGEEHSFVLGHLGSGTYHVYARCTAGDRELQSPFMDLTLTDSDIEDVNLVLEPGTDVTGKVEMPEKATAEARQVKLHPAGSQLFERYRVGDVASDGSFTIRNVFAERYRIEVDPMPENSFIRNVTVNGTSASGSVLDLSGGAQETKLKIVVAANGAQISGHVQSGKDEGAAFASVLLVPDQDSIDAEDCLLDNASLNGSYSFKGVAPGRYRIMAVKLLIPVPQQIMQAVRQHRGKGELVDVKEGEKVTRDVKLMQDEEGNGEPE